MGNIVVRNTKASDFDGITRLSRTVYPDSAPWTAPYLASHLERFPRGQFVAVDSDTGAVVGMAASLILSWEDYGHIESYGDFTDGGLFTNHDPAGRTLYGAEVMVDPGQRRRGIGSKIYAARRTLVRDLGLLRIRAGARIPDYHRCERTMTAEEYVIKVIHGELSDPTLTFQLRQGFDVLDVVSDYFSNDARSRDYAAFIEWINSDVAAPADYAGRNPIFRRDRAGV
ncbi:MAG: GNAT family N-acetyltransferase [Rhodothermia bacterium]|nr:GNAT family N-acetyltransferase [Rhodothermia bacterium]